MNISVDLNDKNEYVVMQDGTYLLKAPRLSKALKILDSWLTDKEFTTTISRRALKEAASKILWGEFAQNKKQVQEEKTISED